MLKIVTIIGARPQFIKAAAVSNAIKQHNAQKNRAVVQELIIHTGQHFDANMSDVFFKEMNIPQPHFNLNINSLSHGAMTGRMMEAIEEILIKEEPDWVLVYGDTNSTLAGALAAAKLHIKIAHVEAGLRSYNMNMPEEINRILTDRISSVLFCPTENAMENLKKEGFDDFPIKKLIVGDVMFDTTLMFSTIAKKPLFDCPNSFILATIHRAENTDNEENLHSIFAALNEISKNTPIVLPIHPRTHAILQRSKIQMSENLKCVPPVGYLEMLYLLKHCKMVFTDSGGLQKEAYFFRKYCITLRNETEWVELVTLGANRLVGSSFENIIASFHDFVKLNFDFDPSIYGSGSAAKLIVEEIVGYENQ